MTTIARRGSADTRFAVRLALALCAAVLLWGPVAVLVVLARDQWAPLRRLDLSILRNLHAIVLDHPILVRTLELISLVGGPTTFRVAATLVAVWLLAAHRPRAAIWALVTTWGAALVGIVLKLVVERARPAFPDPVASPPGFSFPSGHALASLVGCAVLLLVILPGLSRSWKVVAWAVAVGIVVLVGLSRVGLGVHYASDVIGGWLIGLGWVAVTVALFEAWRTEAGLPPAETATEGLEPEGEEPPMTGQLANVTDPSERALDRVHSRVRHEADAVREPFRHARHVSLIWLAFPLVGTLVGLLLVHVLAHGFIGHFDRSVATSLADHRTPGMNALTKVLSWLAETPTIILLTAVAMIGMRVAYHRWHESITLLLAVVGEAMAFSLITLLVDRPRPPVPHLDTAPPTSSFPSGHVAASVAFYVTFGVIVSWHTRARWVPWVFGAVGVIVPILVAGSRLYRGMHHVTDVLGGALLAALWVFVLAKLVLFAPCPFIRSDGETSQPVADRHRPVSLEEKPADRSLSAQRDDDRSWAG